MIYFMKTITSLVRFITKTVYLFIEINYIKSWKAANGWLFIMDGDLKHRIKQITWTCLYYLILSVTHVMKEKKDEQEDFYLTSGVFHQVLKSNLI